MDWHCFHLHLLSIVVWTHHHHSLTFLLLILKAILTNNLPDFEWTVQYSQYQSDPGNPTFYVPVENRVNLVLSRLFQMPEFHTM